MTADKLTNINTSIVEMTNKLQSNFSKLGCKIGAQIGDVMSEEMQMVSNTIKQGAVFTKDVGIKSFQFLAKSFALEMHTAKIEKQQLLVMKQSLKIDKQNQKARLANFKSNKKGGIWGWLLWLLGLSAAWLLKGKLALTGIFKFFKGLIPFKKTLEKLKGWKLPKWTKFEGLRKMFLSIKKIPGVAKLAGMTKGLGKFAWWVAVGLEIADFYSNFKKGYTGTEGGIEKKLTAGLTAGLDGFLTSYGQLIGSANTWLAGQMGVDDITKNKKFTTFMTKTKDNTVNIMVGMLKRFLTPSNQNLDGLMSDLKLSDSGEIDNWFMTFGAKIKALPGLIWQWFKDLQIVKGITDAYDFYTGKIKGENKQTGSLPGRVIKPNDVFSNLRNLLPNENFMKVNQASEQRAGLLQELKINNSYQRKIFEKENGGSIAYSPAPQHRPVTQITDSTGDMGIEQMTRQQIGYTF